MNKDLHRLRHLLVEATARVPPEYFLLPVAADPLARYRERVYCYELYHQLRALWPPDWPYSLAAEVDKSGHPVVRGPRLDRAKPDYLVHVPGDMSRNLAVIEVKPSTVRSQSVRGDLQKLTAFIRQAEYFRGIYLFFGGSAGDQDRLRDKCLRQAEATEVCIDRSVIDLYVHASPGQPAKSLHW